MSAILYPRGPVPRVHVIEQELERGETMHITALSDLHVDSALCDRDGLRRLANDRRNLPHHRALAIGDVCDLVMPPDLRRFRPSVRRPSIAVADDFFGAAVDSVVEDLRALDLTWDLISPGNHEDEALKRHGWDATSIIAHALGARRGGYSGILDYRLTMAGSNRRARFRIVYHHGAWGGKYAKGYLGAKDLFRAYPDWHVALYGHNHGGRCDPETMLYLTPTAGGQVIRERTVYLVNCTSWVHALSDDARITHYPERAGYVPQPHLAPLVRVQLIACGHKGNNTGIKVSVEM